MSDFITSAPVSRSAPDLERGDPPIPQELPTSYSTKGARSGATTARAFTGAERALSRDQFRRAMDWTGVVRRTNKWGILSPNVHHRSAFAREVHRKKNRAMRLYHIMNWVVNGLLITQAGLSAVLVALGSTGNVYRVQIAVLGGLNGVITGGLAIIKGQSIPNRFWQYASGLRRVGAIIDDLERRVEADSVVTQGDLEQLWQMYEDVQQQNDLNVPDVWKTNTELVHQFRTEAEQRAVQSARAAETTEAEAVENVDATTT